MTEKNLDITKLLVSHRPLGFEAPYNAGPDERSPGHPQEKQVVKLGVVTPWQTAPKTVLCYWRLNGVTQPVLSMQAMGRAPRQISPFLAVSPLHESAGLVEEVVGNVNQVGEESDSQLCWEVEFGPFAYADRIEYGFTTEPDHHPRYTFSFEISAWRKLRVVRTETSGQLLLSDQSNPVAAISLEALAEDNYCLKLTSINQVTSPPLNQDGKFEPLEVSGGRALLDQKGLILRSANQEILLQSDSVLFEGLISAQGRLEAIRLNFSAKPLDFYGLGERFDHLNQRGLSPDIRVYEEYKNQGSRTYFPIPFGFSPQGFGLYLDTSAYAHFFLPENGPAACEIELAGKELSIYFFTGQPKQIINAYTRLVGRPVLPPDWIFTPWISGNEWNTQVRVMEVVNRGRELDIPTGVIVIEAWADETTFYIFNDGEFAPRSAQQAISLTDFTFPEEGHWPNPKAMVEELHQQGIKVLLWQIPVLKSLEEVEQSMAERAAAGQKPQPHSLEQHRRDIAYALDHDFVVKNADGTPYLNPGIWFHNAYVLDLTNPAAQSWWLSRRKYLVEELGIDGFKTDGGEHLWGRDLRFWDGRRGSELINAYPRLYSHMYFEAMQKWKGEGITFSRAGFTGSQLAPCHWAGDENSTFAAFRHSIVAGLSAGLSGIPFWGWDIAGFSGPLPTAELYLRAAGMALFCPIMQYHSEYNAHQQPLHDRTPWNVAEQDNAPWLVEAYARLARHRLELVPYLVQAARYATSTGEPIMRAMVLDWPDDLECRNLEDQYMLGSSYLVAPVVEEGSNSRSLYLPKGKWQDYWEGEAALIIEGGRWLKEYPAPILEKPVLVFTKSPIVTLQS